MCSTRFANYFNCTKLTLRATHWKVLQTLDCKKILCTWRITQANGLQRHKVVFDNVSKIIFHTRWLFIKVIKIPFKYFQDALGAHLLPRCLATLTCNLA